MEGKNEIERDQFLKWAERAINEERNLNRVKYNAISPVGFWIFAIFALICAVAYTIFYVGLWLLSGGEHFWAFSLWIVPIPVA